MVSTYMLTQDVESTQAVVSVDSTPIVEPMLLNTKKSKSSNPEVLRLTQVMVDYYVTIENCSARIRNLPNPVKLYDDALEKYMKNPMYRTPRCGRARKEDVLRLCR